jgi:hypothetical protein
MRYGPTRAIPGVYPTAGRAGAVSGASAPPASAPASPVGASVRPSVDPPGAVVRACSSAIRGPRKWGPVCDGE